jgi:outer membrane immunogenic protein
MKKFLLGTVALAAVAAVNSASAADLPTRPIYKAPVVVPVEYSWTGCYIGVNVGGKSAHTDGSVDIAAANGVGGPSPANSFPLTGNDSSTVIGGGQVGCNYQTGHIVFGIEGDADWQRWSTTRTFAGAATPTTNLFVPGDTFDVSSKWQASIRGRLGYAWDRALIYATGGVGFTNVRVGTNFIPVTVLGTPFPGTIATDSQTFAGPTVGGGFEYAIWQNVSFGVEGRYTWYGSHTFNSGLVATSANPGPVFTFAPATTTLKLNTLEVPARLNWRFGWDSPVVSRY